MRDSYEQAMYDNPPTRQELESDDYYDERDTEEDDSDEDALDVHGLPA